MMIELNPLIITSNIEFIFVFTALNIENVDGAIN